ncbi:methylmalonyl-CoA epimerase [Herpetosiphon llansteffanensis]
MEQLLTRVDHLGLAVHDLEQAIASYRDQLALDQWEIIEMPERHMRVAVGMVGTTLLELIAPTSPDAAFAKFLAERGEGIHHIAYTVENIDHALERLQAQGVRLIDREARPGIHGTRIAFLHPKALHGVLTELVEHPKPII